MCDITLQFNRLTYDLQGYIISTMAHIEIESLAGRIAYIELQPFTLDEVTEHGTITDHWLRGGFPDSFLAEDDAASYR